MERQECTVRRKPELTSDFKHLVNCIMCTDICEWNLTTGAAPLVKQLEKEEKRIAKQRAEQVQSKHS